jgi:serine kinase of HPr protein (carbohydrate metabolism regulator)
MKKKLTLKEIFQGSSSALGIKEVCSVAGLKKEISAIKIRLCNKIPFALSKNLTPVILIISPQALSQLHATGINKCGKMPECLFPKEVIFLFMANISAIPLFLKIYLKKYKIPAAASEFDKYHLKSRLIGLLREKLQETVLFHGVVFEAQGKGILLVGASGIGKTTAALDFVRETPIPKALRIGIGKLNNPAKRRVQCPAACCGMFPKLALGFKPVVQNNDYWVADDFVSVKKNNKGELVARSHRNIRNLIHTTYTGIISVHKLLEPDRIKMNTSLRAVIEVTRDETADYLVTRRKKQILGCILPCLHVRIPQGSYFDKNLLKKYVERLSEEI